MKKFDLADAALLLLIPLTMIGFSASIHTRDRDISTTKAAQVNKIGENIDTEYSGDSDLNKGNIRPLYFQPSRVFSVKYRTVSFKTVLDEDYREEKLYRYVPGLRKTIALIVGQPLRPAPANGFTLIKKRKPTIGTMTANAKVKISTGSAFPRTSMQRVTGSMKMRLTTDF